MSNSIMDYASSHTEIPSSPPLPIKQAIEKSILYILKNGPSFEEKLIQNDNQGQFKFLSPEDPHYSYYKYRLDAENEKKLSEDKKGFLENGKGSRRVEKPRELMFLTQLPPISNHDLEIIKATSLYVACNSNKHSEELQKHMDRKGRRNQFAFMNKTHTLHGLFQSYIKQYKAIIDRQNHKASESDKLIDSYISPNAHTELLQKAYERAAFEKRHKIKEKSREQEFKKKQLHYASIDWQDMALVAKISFDAIDEVLELAVPLQRESVVYRSLDEKAKDLKLDMNSIPRKNTTTEERVTETKEVVSSKEKLDEHVPVNVPKGMRIKAAGESRLKRKANEQKVSQNGSLRCPITGTLVPEKDFDMHLKTLLRDPRYKDQQENFVRKNFTYESNLTTEQVYDNIKRLVRKRGQSEEEEAFDTKRINIDE